MRGEKGSNLTDHLLGIGGRITGTRGRSGLTDPLETLTCQTILAYPRHSCFASLLETLEKSDEFVDLAWVEAKFRHRWMPRHDALGQGLF
jgi:hypothetical protein